MTNAMPAFNTEFPFECACGEQYTEVHFAATCRKCRNYCAFGRCTHVTDLRTGEVVWGTEPTAEEHEAQVALMTPIWEEERRQLQLEIQMWRQEGELWEAEQAAQREREAAETAAAAEDTLYDIQDALMGY